MNSYIFSCTMTFETVIKANSKEQAQAAFLRPDCPRADVVHDSGITIQVIEDAPPPMPYFTLGGAA
jgi:hypothetical protein